MTIEKNFERLLCPNAGNIQYTVEKAGLRVIVLDTHEPGLHGGAFAKTVKSGLSHSFNLTLVVLL